jgi:hypothetical protein
LRSSRSDVLGRAIPPQPLAPPTDDELHALLQTIITRLMKMLTRQDVLVE